jgi:hypothetical protein
LTKRRDWRFQRERRKGLAYSGLTLLGGAHSGAKVQEQSFAMRKHLLDAAGVKHPIMNYPVNDFIQGRSGANIQSDFQADWLYWRPCHLQLLSRTT